MYQKIVNPITGRKINIYNKRGINILNQYIYMVNHRLKKIGGSSQQIYEKKRNARKKQKQTNLILEKLSIMNEINKIKNELDEMIK